MDEPTECWHRLYCTIQLITRVLHITHIMYDRQNCRFLGEKKREIFFKIRNKYIYIHAFKPHIFSKIYFQCSLLAPMLILFYFSIYHNIFPSEIKNRRRKLSGMESPCISQLQSLGKQVSFGEFYRKTLFTTKWCSMRNKSIWKGVLPFGIHNLRLQSYKCLHRALTLSICDI